jgi:N-acetylglucosaminyldiphosphoundecaprenol N-acetyl-beta-D-mannosaminyltransferase
MASCPELTRVNILGVGISAINMAMALDQLACWIEQRQRVYVAVCAVHPIVACQFDEDHRALLNHANMVTPDGMPLVFVSRIMGHPHVDRVYGPDLMLAFTERMAQRGYSSYYYGGAEGVPELLAETLTQRFPGLKVVGTYSPPFRALMPDEEQAIIDQINAAQPDVVWVGLGSPKQEFWMKKYRERLNAPVLIGVGAAFDFVTDRKPQAPRWMQRHALEWVFRLWHEPRRLWQRYVIYNPLFILYVLLQLLGLRRIPLDDQPDRS